MKFTASVLETLGKINGPRCCKRDAMVSLQRGTEYVNSHYSVHLENETPECVFSPENRQCIRERCPFHASARSCESKA